MSSPDQPIPVSNAPLESAAAVAPTPPSPPPRDPVWTGLDVLLILGVAVGGLFLASIGLGVVVGMLAAFQRKAPELDLVVIGMLAQTFGYLLVVAFMHFLVEVRYRAPFWEAVKWRWPRGAGAAAFLVGGVALAICVQVASAWLPIPKSLPIQELLKEPSNAWLLAAFGILVAPFVEEMYFRGFLYPVLVRRVDTARAVLLTALAFTAIHGPQLAHHWAPLLLLFSVSLVFTLARVQSGSVAMPFLMHVGYNSTLFGMLFWATDGFQHMEKALQ